MIQRDSSNIADWSKVVAYLDESLLKAALSGLEFERSRIQAAIAEIQVELGNIARLGRGCSRALLVLPNLLK